MHLSVHGLELDGSSQRRSLAQQVIPLAVPNLGAEEQAYVQDALESGRLRHGPYVERFQSTIAGFVRRKHAVATANGTAALHIALQVAGARPDDEVAVSALTFISPGFAIRHVGAWPIPIDVEPRYGQIDPAQLRAFLERECEPHNGAIRNRVTGRRVAAVLPVGILGHPVDMDEITKIAHEFELPVVEDAAQTLGAFYYDRPAGSAPADVSCVSFNENKVITSGAGGMVLTDRHDWAERALYLTTGAKQDPFESIHGDVGFNYRLSNVHAALGLAQAQRLTTFVEAKRQIAARYAEGLTNLPGVANFLLRRQERAPRSGSTRSGSANTRPGCRAAASQSA